MANRNLRFYDLSLSLRINELCYSICSLYSEFFCNKPLPRYNELGDKLSSIWLEIGNLVEDSFKHGVKRDKVVLLLTDYVSNNCFDVFASYSEEELDMIFRVLVANYYLLLGGFVHDKR